PDFRELINPRPMDVAEVQATLGEGEVLLFTLSGTWETYIWAISRDRADWHAVFFPDPDDMKGRVTALRRLLSSTENARAAEAMSDEGDSFPAIRAFDRGLAHGIYGDLLAPLAHVFDGAEHLLLVPDGPLTSLPFGLLIASEPQGADDDPFALRDTDWLIKRHALTVLPNVSSLRALRRDEAEAPVDRRPFVGFGDPIFAYGRDDLGPTGIVADGDYVTRGAFEELSEVANLAQLPGTRRELRRLALLTGADMERDLFLGEAATESAVRAADLEDVEILAFATHGLLAGELSGLAEPALVFTPPGEPGEADDALLTASEAAGLRLSADLIILSACNTAASDGTPGSDGLSGLARSFIYAGAQSILVSHWPVDDRATVALTTGMVGQMAEGTSRAAALRTAMLALMEDDADPRYAHPRFWAPFILVGEGA
ncbi:MAG: CHAT domain-containing protein, partial [Pseudomonadota bacterium]